jgi:hypothetical protein
MGEVLGRACSVAEQSVCPGYPGLGNRIVRLESIKPFAGVDGLPIVAGEQREVIAIVKPYRIVGCHIMEPIEPRPCVDHRTSDLDEAIGVLADGIGIVGREVNGRARRVDRALLIYQCLTRLAQCNPGPHIIRLFLDSLPQRRLLREGIRWNEFFRPGIG